MERLSFEEFCVTVKDSILEYLPEKYQDATMELVDVDKNNGITYCNLSIHVKGFNVALALNMNKVYKLYLDGVDLPDVIQKCTDDFIRAMEKTDVKSFGAKVEMFHSFEKARGNIIFALVNAERNAELLKECPHRIIGGLAVIYKLLLSTENALGVGVIKNSHMELMETDEETLFRVAQENMPKLLPPCLTPMGDIVGNLAVEVFEEDSEEAQEVLQYGVAYMFVLTNKEQISGASVMLYPGVMEALKSRFGDFYIIPLSTEEVIIIPACYVGDLSYMKEMVSDVNAMCMKPDMVLSDELYRPTEDGVFEVVEVTGRKAGREDDSE